MINNQKINLALASLRPHTDEKDLSNQIVNIWGKCFGFHNVSLFLADQSRQNAILRAGYGKFAQNNLLHGHKLPLSQRGPVTNALNFGEIQVGRIIHPSSFQLGYEGFTCLPPAKMQIDTPLNFVLVQSDEPLDCQYQSAIPLLIGWEICFPMRQVDAAFGVIHILIQLELNAEEKKRWPIHQLTDSDETVEFSISDCAKLQWLADQISPRFTKSRAG